MQNSHDCPFSHHCGFRHNHRMSYQRWNCRCKKHPFPFPQVPLLPQVRSKSKTRLRAKLQSISLNSPFPGLWTVNRDPPRRHSRSVAAPARVLPKQNISMRGIVLTAKTTKWKGLPTIESHVAKCVIVRPLPCRGHVMAAVASHVRKKIPISSNRTLRFTLYRGGSLLSDFGGAVALVMIKIDALMKKGHNRLAIGRRLCRYRSSALALLHARVGSCAHESQAQLRASV